MTKAQVGAVLVVALVFIAAAAVLLGNRESRRADTNGVSPDAFIVDLKPGQEACLANVVVPSDARSVRVFIGTHRRPGPDLTLFLRDGTGRVIRRGELRAGYRDAAWQRIAFEPLERVGRDYGLCFHAAGRIALAGSGDSNLDPFSELRVDGRPQGGEIAYQLLRGGRETLLQLLPTVFQRAALFRPGWIGSWTYYVAALVLLLAGVLAVGAMIAATSGGLSTRLQVAIVVAVALTNALVWSVVMPSFHPPDEAAHYAYTASLVELGRRPYTDPARPGGSYSAEATLAISYVALDIVQNQDRRPPWTRFEEEEWRAQNATIKERQPELIGGGWTTVAAYSPAYYALAAPAYAAAQGESVFTRLWLMRLVSVLLAAATAAVAFFLGRELLPDAAWAPVVSALSVAFQPMFAQLGGAVNNDDLLILLGSLELYLLLRILRRGLTAASGLAAGTVLGLGILTKPNMYAFVPVAAFVLGWVLFRERRRLQALAVPAGLAVGAALFVTIASYVLFSQGEVIASTTSGSHGSGGDLRTLMSYFWQWYLPELPSMTPFWSGSIPVWDIYFRGFWADFAHLDTQFPGWVYVVIGFLSVAALAFAVRAVIQERERRDVLVAQVLVLVGAVASSALLVTYRSYLALVQSNVQPFAQGRYLLQTVVVVGAFVALGARGLGDRWGPPAAAALVTGLFMFNLFSLGLVLTRFYT